MSEGTVYKRSDGRWAGEYTDRQGRRRYIYRRTKDEARKALRAKLRERDDGASGDDPTLEAWSSWWLDQLDLRPTTVADYRYKIGLLPQWLTRRKLSELSPMDVHEALTALAQGTTSAGRPRAASTIAQVRTVLGACLHVAQRYGHVTRNAATLAAPVAFTHAEPEPLTLDEARALLGQVKGHRLESLFTVALSLGLRQGECAGLEWRDVDLDAGTITINRQITRTNQGVESAGVPKTRRSARSLTLPRVCVSQLKAHRRAQAAERLERYGHVPRQLVWPSEAGTALSPSNLRRLLYRQLELAGITRRVTFHALRHSAATIMLAQGVPDVVILEVLGHQDTRMLRRYVHVTDSLRQGAADSMDAAWGTVKSTVNREGRTLDSGS